MLVCSDPILSLGPSGQLEVGDRAVLKKIDLNELPHWTPWIDRLLHPEAWSRPERNIQKIELEYNQDKWLNAYALHKEMGAQLNPLQLMMRQDPLPADAERCVYRNGQLLQTNLLENYEYLYGFLRERIAEPMKRVDGIVELGSAFGHNLWALARYFEGKKFIGGEYSENAVSLARCLYENQNNITVENFNFYDERYSIFNNIDNKAIVLTSIAIEQCPSAKPFINGLAGCKEKIASVVNLEPTYEALGDATYDLICKRYIEVNDYNRDLLSSLREREDVDIISFSFGVHSFNPILPLSFVHWRFRD